MHLQEVISKNIVFCLIPTDLGSAVVTTGLLIFAAAVPGGDPGAHDLDNHTISLLRMVAIVAAVAVSTWTVRSKLSSIENTETNLGKDIETMQRDVDGLKIEVAKVKQMISDLPCEEMAVRCRTEHK